MAKSTADKKRRDRRLAIGGAVLLGVLLLVQVPRTLKMLDQSATPAPAAEASSNAATSTGSPVVVAPLTETEPKRSSFPGGRGYGRKDPFAARSLALGSPAGGRAVGDPGFRLVAVSAPAVQAAAAPRGKFIVVLRSVPVADGRPAAVKAAAEFRRLGFPAASVLASSRYTSLRKGYYVVHAGRFPSRLAALQTLLRARSAGASNPYVRALKA
jgi:hypothetical protein